MNDGKTVSESNPVAKTTVADGASWPNDREMAVDVAIHVAAIAAAIVGCLILVFVAAAHWRPAVVVAVAAYGFGLLSVLVCSALYNGSRPSPRKDMLRRFDHAAIFLLIAGTYSPFLASAADDPRIASLLAGVWIVALLGLSLKLLFPLRFHGFFIALYLVLGWSVIAVLDAVAERLSAPVLVLIVSGGVLYSIGVIFHLLRRFPYQDAVWHGFVVIAAGCHYAALLLHLRA
jgi:hemolysin III